MIRVCAAAVCAENEAANRFFPMKLLLSILAVCLPLCAPTPAADGKEAGANESGTRHAYKTVGKEELSLFVYSPKGHPPGAKVPAIVFFHGGGFKNGSPTQFSRQAEYLAARGMVAVSASYRLLKQPSQGLDICIEDARSAMRWVRANAGKLGVDPDRIAAGGGSAGGYLAVATLLGDFTEAQTDPAGVSAKPNALVLFNPALGSLRPGGSIDPRDAEGKYELGKHVKAGQPPCIQFFGTEDTFLAGARPFMEAYRKAGNRCELITYEGEGHSFFNKDKYYQLTIAEADQFLVGLGWLEKRK